MQTQMRTWRHSFSRVVKLTGFLLAYHYSVLQAPELSESQFETFERLKSFAKLCVMKGIDIDSLTIHILIP